MKQSIFIPEHVIEFKMVMDYFRRGHESEVPLYTIWVAGMALNSLDGGLLVEDPVKFL